MSRALALLLFTTALPCACATGPLATATGTFGQTRLNGPAEARNHYAPIVAMLWPGYTLRVDAADEPGEPEHGLVWSVPLWFRDPDWRHGAAFSLAQFPSTGRRSGRAVYRLRAWSAPAEHAIVHLLVGGGGFYDLDDGPGPRAEVSWLLGRFGRGGALLTVGWEYVPSETVHSGDLALTFFVPYVIR